MDPSQSRFNAVDCTRNGPPVLSSCHNIHMFSLHLHGRSLHGKKGTCYFLASAQCCCERLDRARVFSLPLAITYLSLLTLLTHSLTHSLTCCSFPIRLCLIHKHFLCCSLRTSSSSSFFLPCLPGWLSIYLPCHHHRQLHFTTRKHRSDNVETKSAGAGGERGVLEELQEVENDEYGYVCFCFFCFIIRGALH